MAMILESGTGIMLFLLLICPFFIIADHYYNHKFKVNGGKVIPWKTGIIIYLKCLTVMLIILPIGLSLISDLAYSNLDNETKLYYSMHYMMKGFVFSPAIAYYFYRGRRKKWYLKNNNSN
jgi:hypothetical protein